MTTFLRISEVLERVGLSRAAIYALDPEGSFPEGRQGWQARRPVAIR